MNEVSAKRKAALWVAAIFLLGAALGAVGGYMYAHHSVFASAPPSEPERRAHRVEQLTKELGLSDDQRQQLDKSLAQIHADYKSVHEQSDAMMEQARQKGRAQIRSFLTPDQLPKFEEFLRKMDEERKKNPPPQPR